MVIWSMLLGNFLLIYYIFFILKNYILYSKFLTINIIKFNNIIKIRYVPN